MHLFDYSQHMHFGGQFSINSLSLCLDFFAQPQGTSIVWSKREDQFVSCFGDHFGDCLRHSFADMGGRLRYGKLLALAALVP